MGTRALNPQQLGQILRVHRTRRGLTQADLAQRSGVLPKTISALENNSGNCRISTLLRVLTALDLQLGLLPKADSSPPLDSDW